MHKTTDLTYFLTQVLTKNILHKDPFKNIDKFDNSFTNLLHKKSCQIKLYINRKDR